jgi:hypothetical protein
MKSTDFLIGQSVFVDDRKYTKRTNAEVGQNVSPEIWTTVDGKEYEPTLTFQEGVGEIDFNPLQA